jgi:hypothetical protein
MPRSNRLTRTFWPATEFADLPHAFTIESRLANWALQWFGSSASLDTPQIVTAPDLDKTLQLARDGEVAVAVRISDEYVSHLSSKVPLLLSRDEVIAEHAAEFVADLCQAVFGLDAAEVQLDASGESLSNELLMIDISTELCEGTSLTLFVSADAYFGQPEPAEMPVPSLAHPNVLGSTPVKVSVEKSFSMNVNDLFDLSVGDFVPVSDVGDVRFSLTVKDAPVGVGYIGQIDNKLNVVIES